MHFKSFHLLLVFLLESNLIIAMRKTGCPRMKLKAQWGGKPARELNYQAPPIGLVIVHHTVTGECKKFEDCAGILQNLQHFHMNELNYADIGYNFLIGDDGVVYEGRGWSVGGAHTYHFNANSTGIAFIGNFMSKLPSRSALSAAKKLLNCGIKLGDLAKNYRLIGANQVSGTKSPGLALYNKLQQWHHWALNP